MIEDTENKVVEEISLKKEMVYQKKTLQTIEKTLQFSGLKLESQINFRAISIYQIDHVHEIYTNNQDSCLPHMVLLHGFGGTSMTYVRFFKKLKNYYRMHAIDALGVGHSSKGVFKENFTYEQARNYFIEAIEQWRKKLAIKNFVLVGHSFGGYLATCYTETYPDRVSRLILLSPAGATDKTPEEIQQQLKKRYKNDGIRGKFFGYFAETVYNLKIRPSKAMGAFILGERLIDRIVDVRLKLKHEQRDAWKSYFKDLAKRQSVSEVGFYIIFQWPLKTKHTIESMITRMKFTKPLQFYYGEHDWMDSCGAERLAQKYDNILFNRITEADHQLIFDNPDQVCHYIVLRRSPQELALEAENSALFSNKN